MDAGLDPAELERKADEWVEAHPDGAGPKRHPIRKLWDTLRGGDRHSDD